MVTIIDLHTRYSSLLPPVASDMIGNVNNTSELSTSGGIESVPSHPLYSADIEVVRQKFVMEIHRLCTIQYRKNFAAFMKSLPKYSDEDNVTKDMALTCLNMIDMHEKADSRNMRSAECWNNARTKSIVMLLELLWSNKIDQGFFCQSVSSISNKNKVKRQILTTLQILAASCDFASSHNGMKDRLVTHLFIPFIQTLPNSIATMSISYDSRGSVTSSQNSTDELASQSECQGNVTSQHMEVEDHNHPISSFCTTVLDGESECKVQNCSPPPREHIKDTVTDGPVIALVHIERCVLSLIISGGEDGNEESNEAALNLIHSLVRRKIDVRDKIMGYTTCFREMLWSYSDITQKTVYNSLHRRYFPLFFPIVHCPLPPVDELWGQALALNIEYEKEIDQYPFLDSERELILRAMLSLEIPDTLRSVSDRKMPSCRKSNQNYGGMSDTSDAGTCISSTDDSKQKKRLGRLQRTDNANEGVNKRKRYDEVESTTTPSKEKDSNPVSTPPSRKSTRNLSESASKGKSTPSRMRIIRKFGEC